MSDEERDDDWPEIPPHVQMLMNRTGRITSAVATSRFALRDLLEANPALRMEALEPELVARAFPPDDDAGSVAKFLARLELAAYLAEWLLREESNAQGALDAHLAHPPGSGGRFSS